ncbi:hypothetical protein [Vibrio phage ICP2]|uniref:Uncharacterized protein 53 n=1 Tax=Vibrio phage ICP2 TaxID=979533 RepID=F1D0R1_9CAUD|nr:hypothetical protein ViPhICP2p52 [Vibrio phage ICP2]ADX87734.1 hypothetical protein [Vibrio phage ICP2]
MQTEAQKRWYEENKEHHREMGRKWLWKIQSPLL